MYKLVRYLKFIVLLNIYNQDAKASHLKLRKNVPLLITIFNQSLFRAFLLAFFYIRSLFCLFIQECTLAENGKMGICERHKGAFACNVIAG